MDTIRGRVKHSFTLIELLVVVGLSALILGLGIPAFNRMMRGNKVEESSRSIKLGLEQAQLRAASERRHVAAIFPNGADADVSSALHSSRLGGYRLAYVKKEASGSGDSYTYAFDKWLDSKWRNAPDGAMLVKVVTSEPATGKNISDCSTKVNEALAGAGNFVAVSGVKDDNGAAVDVGANTAVIFTPYGGITAGNKLYLVVSETAANGDDISYPSTGTSGETANYFVLKVNNLTGRVEYYGNE